MQPHHIPDTDLRIIAVFLAVVMTVYGVKKIAQWCKGK